MVNTIVGSLRTAVGLEVLLARECSHNIEQQATAKFLALHRLAHKDRFIYVCIIYIHEGFNPETDLNFFIIN